MVVRFLVGTDDVIYDSAVTTTNGQAFVHLARSCRMRWSGPLGRFPEEDRIIAWYATHHSYLTTSIQPFATGSEWHSKFCHILMVLSISDLVDQNDRPALMHTLARPSVVSQVLHDHLAKATLPDDKKIARAAKERLSEYA